MSRPFFRNSLSDLKALSRASAGDPIELQAILDELRFRKTDASKALAKKLTEQLLLLRTTNYGTEASRADETVQPDNEGLMPSQEDMPESEQLRPEPDAAQNPATSDPKRSAISKLFNETRMRLVETGTRNRLVHVNRANTRGNVLNIVNERSDEVYRILSSNKAMKFHALGKDQIAEGDEIRLVSESDEGVSDDRLTDQLLETRLGPDALQKQLLKISREAKTAEEESGANILYLALGFMTWYEDKSSAVTREAPLILLPVALVRNARTSTYDLRIRDDEIVTNLPLQQRLMEDFGLQLPEVEISEDWLPSDYFSRIREIAEGRDRWKVDEDAIQLGFFSFSKLLMFRDLDVEAWPDGALADHDLTQRVLYEGFENENPLFGEREKLDPPLPPERLFHVVDADASQTKVIEEVRSGRNLVVQGPPGTGKSQTITNIIATAVNEGKRVLFVAEKMAALSVVHDRLVKVGLRDICLELHSRTANKKLVLQEIAHTIASATKSKDASENNEALRAVRDQLNAISDVLHKEIADTGETPFSVLATQAKFLGNGALPPTLAHTSLGVMSREEEETLATKIERYASLLEIDGCDVSHPFEGARNLDLQPVDITRLASELDAATEAIDLLLEAIQSACSSLEIEAVQTLSFAEEVKDLLGRLEGLPGQSESLARVMLECSDLPRLQETLVSGAAWKAAFDEAKSTFVDAAFGGPSNHLRPPIVTGTQSFFARWGAAYRNSSRELAGLLRDTLPKGPQSRLDLVDALCDLESMRANWEEDRDYCARILGDAWRGEKTDFQNLASLAEWCTNVQLAAAKPTSVAALKLALDADSLSDLFRALTQALPKATTAAGRVISSLDFELATLGEDELENVPLDDLSSRFKQMLSQQGRYATWGEIVRLRETLDQSGLEQISEALRNSSLSKDGAVTELKFARAEAIWRSALERSPELGEISALNRHHLVADFSKLEREKLGNNVDQILSKHFAQVPLGATGQMGVIRGEIAKKRGHKALRRLFNDAGEAIQRIKPVLLMSPISIAQFVPPGSVKFDLLVIDEASQVRPEDALGAIARANQIVVVGDKQQLPPTSFFDRLLDGETEDEDNEDAGVDLLEGAASVGSMESILTLCEARGVGSRMLNWHYRSRDPSLIKVSNKEFYKNELILPPSPLQNDPAYGLKFTKVDGIYDRGGKRDNRKEAEAVADRVAKHARETGSLSLGIVTFAVPQRNLITEVLEMKRRTDAVLDKFLKEGQAEDVFVKNIENVQGDERDVILISVGYGPSVPGGKPGALFGPVNGDGGERRLNVLFTRARVRCEIFASFDPGELDVSRASQQGPRILKRFLEFAKLGGPLEEVKTGALADSPFEEDVADVIRSFGFMADPQVGSAGFKIDIGVRHPDMPHTYLLAVECDGATYHSALWARERDRLRQDVLEHLGWRFHRVWSTDWFYNRNAEIERLRLGLLEALEAAKLGVRIEGANEAHQTETSATPEMQVVELPEATERKMPAYERAIFSAPIMYEPHEAPPQILTDLVWKIVEAEGPIHVDEVARRLSACFRKEKAGSRIIKAASSALCRAKRVHPDLHDDDEFFWHTSEQKNSPPVRDRSQESGATLKASSISMLEIAEALRIAREDNAGGDRQELIKSAARLLGFKRVGGDLQKRIAAGLRSTGWDF